VFVGADDRIMLQWPMPRIVDLLPGRDGVVRTANVKIQIGILVRLAQRLFPTEEELGVARGQSVKPDDLCNFSQSQSVVRDSGTAVYTRSGRRVTRPRRYED